MTCACEQHQEDGVRYISECGAHAENSRRLIDQTTTHAARKVLEPLQSARVLVGRLWASAKLDTPQELALHSVLVDIDKAIKFAEGE